MIKKDRCWRSFYVHKNISSFRLKATLLYVGLKATNISFTSKSNHADDSEFQKKYRNPLFAGWIFGIIYLYFYAISEVLSFFRGCDDTKFRSICAGLIGKKMQ